MSYVICMAKNIKWKLTNKEIAEKLGKSLTSISVYKKHGLPNSKSKKVLVDWHKGYIAQRASRTSYKLSNVEIGKLLRINKKGMLKETLANKVSRLRKLGLPNTKDFKEVTYWYENFLLTKEDKKNKIPIHLAKKLDITESNCRNWIKKGMPTSYNKALSWLRNKEKKATLQQIGDALGLSKERVRQMVKFGMPFNESLTPIKDAEKWYKKTQEIGVAVSNIKKFEDKGMPFNNIEKSKEWVKKNCFKTPYGLWRLKK